MKRVLLNIFLLGLVICAAVLLSKAQKPSFENLTSSVMFQTIPENKTLVADETWIMASGKSSFRIICVNENLQSLIFTRWRKELTRYSGYPKTDKTGERYEEVSYYFKNEKYVDVMAFIKRGFK